ncbi:hypothetical protein [Tenacibaculum salmonis]|uniref:hypothetical protein n=1 Tax=Tenacibaculum sp. P3-BQ1 TaxID=3232310 RepID=UPI0034E041ED
MKKLVLTFILILVHLISNSQNCIKKGTIEELKQLKERELAVVIYDEDKEYIQKLEKKIAKNNRKKEEFKNELKEYKNHISFFNKAIKEVVTEYWKLNNTDNIKYITKKEVNKLAENKSKKFAVLDLTFEKISADYYNFHTMDIYVITYGSPIKRRYKSTFKNFINNVIYNLPDHGDKKQKKQIESLKTERENKAKVLSKENLIISISLSQKYIEKVIKLNKKISFEDFAEQESKENCSKIDNKTILIQEASVHGKIQDDLSSLFPKANIQLVSSDRIAEAIENKEDVFIGFPAIKKFVKQKGGVTVILPISHKILLNTKTKNIVGFVKHSGITSYNYFKKKDFKKLSNQCK